MKMTKVIKKNEHIENLLLTVPFDLFGKITVSLPLFGLVYCLSTGLLFKFDEVNETVCSVSRKKN